MTGAGVGTPDDHETDRTMADHHSEQGRRDVSDGTAKYPHVATCDVCAVGVQPVRIADPETCAWICQECDDRMIAATKRAAHVMGVRIEIAEAGIDAYFKAMDQ